MIYKEKCVVEILTLSLIDDFFVENGTIQVPAQLSLEFRVFLVNRQTEKHTQESRILRYWFRRDPKSLSDAGVPEEATVAQEFFRELVTPQEFPRGKSLPYTSFFALIFFLGMAQPAKYLQRWPTLLETVIVHYVYSLLLLHICLLFQIT